MAEKTMMTLEGLLEKTPEMFRPVVMKYGPALVEMTAQEFAEWLALLINGKDLAAWRTILGKLPGKGLLDAWRDIDDEWAHANKQKAAQVALQRRCFWRLPCHGWVFNAWTAWKLLGVQTMQTTKKLLDTWARPLAAKYLTRLLIWGGAAISAKMAIESPSDDTMTKVAEWAAAVGCAVVAMLIDRWHDRKDKAAAQPPGA